MKQIVDKLNDIAKAIDESVELPTTGLITDSLDAITTAFGGTPSESKLIVDKLDDIASVAHGGGGTSYITYLAETTITTVEMMEGLYLVDLNDVSIPMETTPLYITFDGIDYTVPYDADYGTYGAQYVDSDGFDWSTYPFSIYNTEDAGIEIITEVVGNHTIEIKGEGDSPTPTPTPTVEPFIKVISEQQLITPTLQNGKYSYSLPKGASLSSSYNNTNAVVYYENNEYSCPITFDSSKYVYACGDSTFSSYPFYIEEDADRHYNTAFFEDDTAILFGLSIYVITCSGTLRIIKNGTPTCSGFQSVDVSVYSELTKITINRTDSINQNVNFHLGVEINKINFANEVKWYDQTIISPDSTKEFGFPKTGNDPFYVVFTHPYNTNLTISADNMTIRQTTFDNNHTNCTVGFVPVSYIPTIYIALSV